MSAQLNFELYLGTDDQLPDPTIEAYENEGYVGNVTRRIAASRTSSSTISNSRSSAIGSPTSASRCTTGTALECGIYSAGVLQPWVEGGRDPRDHDYLETYQYRYASGTWHSVFADAVADAEAGSGKQLFTSDVNLHGWERPDNANVQSPCDGISTDDFEVLYLLYNVVDTTQRTCAIDFDRNQLL